MEAENGAGLGSQFGTLPKISTIQAPDSALYKPPPEGSSRGQSPGAWKNVDDSDDESFTLGKQVSLSKQYQTALSMDRVTSRSWNILALQLCTDLST